MKPDPSYLIFENSIEVTPKFVVIALILMLVLLILSAFFSMTETAFTSLNKIRMEKLSEKSKSAKAVMKLIDQYDKVLSTILIGNNIVNIAASALATVLFVEYLGDIGPTVATLVVTIVVLIFGEVSPKSFAKERPEFVARVNIYPLYFFYYLFFPLVLLLGLIQKLIKKIAPSKKEDQIYTEEEFSMLVEDMNEARVLNDIEENIIQNTIEYGDTKVEDIMIPANEIDHIKGNEGIEEISKKFIETNRSRIVVCKTNKLDSAYGVIHQKDLFELIVKKDNDVSKIIMTDLIEAKPTHKISRLFKKLQSSHQHLAIVKDDNKVVGIVTMEDILEELVGDIKDENDED